MECQRGDDHSPVPHCVGKCFISLPKLQFLISRKLTERFSLGILLLEVPPHPRAQFSIVLTGLKLELSKEGRPAASPDLP